MSARKSKKVAKRKSRAQALKNDERVLSYLKSHPKGLNATNSLKLIGVHRLSASVCRLRNRQGYDIKTVPTTIKNRFGETIKLGQYQLSR